jgi:hypothetical protein
VKPEDIMSELHAIIPGQIQKEHSFRVEYLKLLRVAIQNEPRAKYYQLQQNALWMSLYSHINWLAHFKVLKKEKVDSDIPGWLGTVFDWPQETAEAFWVCGRNPIAHTGSHNLPYSEKIKGSRRYIQLSFDDPAYWNTDGAFMALPQTSAGRPKDALPIQQTIFYYQPIEELLDKLMDDITSSVSILNHADILKLQKVMMAFNFFEDDGSLARMNNLLDVYDYVSKAKLTKKSS